MNSGNDDDVALIKILEGVIFCNCQQVNIVSSQSFA